MGSMDGKADDVPAPSTHRKAEAAEAAEALAAETDETSTERRGMFVMAVARLEAPWANQARRAEYGGVS